MWEDIEKPDFVGAYREHWTEDQKRVFVEYDMAVTWREEIRDKRLKALDAELRKLLELVETGCAAYDARLEVSLLFKLCHW